jgi:hypothetical protein
VEREHAAARRRVARPPRACRQADAARGLERDLLPSFPATAAVGAPRSATAAVALSVARGRSTAVSATDGQPDDPESAWRIAWCCLTCTQIYAHQLRVLGWGVCLSIVWQLARNNVFGYLFFQTLCWGMYAELYTYFCTDVRAAPPPADALTRACRAASSSCRLVSCCQQRVLVPALPAAPRHFELLRLSHPSQVIMEGESARGAALATYNSMIYGLCQFFCNPIMGTLSDRFGRRPVLILGCLVDGIGFCFYGR